MWDKKLYRAGFLVNHIRALKPIGTIQRSGTEGCGKRGEM